MKTSTKTVRWSVVSLIGILAGMILLAGWLVKQSARRTPADQVAAGPQAVVARAPADEIAPRTSPRPGQPPEGVGLAGRVWPAAPGVQRLEHPEQSPAWAVKYGQEFWRPGHRTADEVQGADGGQTSAGVNLNLGEVVERVSHAWSADGAAVPGVHSRSYAASLGEDGLRFSPHLPATGDAATTEPAQTAAEATAPAIVPSEPETTVHFRTESVTQAGQALFTAGQSARSWVVLGNTAQALLNEGAGLVEHYEARNNGVEVSWILPRAVAGNGPLVVEAVVNGLSYAGPSASGHHFADESGTARVRVGGVEIVDAAGQAWGAAVEVVGNRLRVEVPADVLAQVIYPMAIDPALEAEFGMDKPVTTPASLDQSKPVVAGGTGGYLVVWQDGRKSLRKSTLIDVYGARVTTAGAVSDPNGIPICTTATWPSTPAVAANGNDYLVVWSEYHSLTDLDIYGARVTSAGKVIHTNGIAISSAPSRQVCPTVAAGGNGYLVVWQDLRNRAKSLLTDQWDIYSARVTATGTVSDTNGIAICTNSFEQSAPSVAASGTNFLVVWQDDRTAPYRARDVYGARVTGGAVRDPDGVAISVNGYEKFTPSVAANGTNFLVVWQDKRHSGTTGSDIFGARVTGGGVVRDTDGFAISSSAFDPSLPAVAPCGTNFLVVWEDKRNNTASGSDVFGARVSPSGTVSEPTGFGICTAAGDQVAPTIAASGTNDLVVWADGRDTSTAGTNIYGARVTSAGTVMPANGLPVSLGANTQLEPAVAFNGTNYLVVWSDNRNAGTDWDIYGVRVLTNGTVSDPNGIGICTAAEEQGFPAVASRGGNFLVVWEDYRTGPSGADIYGGLVTGAGVVSDPNGFGICAAPQHQELPRVAANSIGYLVVWEDSRSGSRDIYGARIGSSGHVVEANGFAICTALNYQEQPAVSAEGSGGWLVVWRDSRNAATYTDIYGARVTVAGSVSEANGFPICTAAGYQSSPAVAILGTLNLVVWSGDGPAARGIYGARVAPAPGGVLDANGLSISTTGVEDYPAVASDGASFTVVWYNPACGLQRRRVSPGGVLLETTPLAVNGSMDRFGPALAYGGSGRFLLVADSIRNLAQRTLGTLLPSGRPQAGPVLAFQSAALQVGETGRLATATIALTGLNPGLVSVDYGTADGSAVAGWDYAGVSGTLWFSSGQTKQTFTVPIIDNAVVNPDQTMNLVLSGSTGGATLGLLNRAVLTIKNDDAGGQLRFGAAAYSVKKSAGSVTLTVMRTAGRAGGVSVACSTGGGTAMAGTHYTTTASTLSFAAGETNQTFTIPIANYGPAEGPKILHTTLYDPAGGATVGSPSVATITIND